MEDMVQEFLTLASTKYTWAAAAYGALTGAYMIFCAVAAFTKTDADDKIAARLKRFFSLPTKK